MVASAYAAHLARRAADYGVTLGGAVEVDMKAVKARKDKVSLRLAHRPRGWLDGMERLHGLSAAMRASISPHEVERRATTF